MLATRIQASALAMEARRPSQAKVRSTTHHRLTTTKPLASSARLRISSDQSPILLSASQLVAGVAAVGEDVAQPRVEVADLLEHEDRAIAVLHVGLVHHQPDHVARCVGHDVMLAALDFLARVVAA